MSDTNATNGTETANGTTAKASPMIAVRAAFEAAGGKYKDGKPVPTTAQMKAAKSAAKDLADAQSKVEAAQAALDAAKEGVYAVSRKVMEATGGVSVTIGGREFIPMAKGNRVYFRTAGQRASVEL